MKRSVLLICLLCCCGNFVLAQNEITIGYTSDTNFIITASLDELEVDWERQLATQELKSELNDWKVIKGSDGNEDYYLLIATNDQGSLKMASRLKLDGTKLILTQSGSKTEKVLVCHGCADGCEPHILEGNLVCSKCEVSGRCTKVTIVNSK